MLTFVYYSIKHTWISYESEHFLIFIFNFDVQCILNLDLKHLCNLLCQFIYMVPWAFIEIQFYLIYIFIVSFIH